MKQMPRISEAEWEVMKVLWQEAPQTANEVIDRLKDKTEWSPNTIRTLLKRLVEKGAVDVDQQGRVNAYAPVVAEADCVRAETRSFLKRIYGGAVKPFLVHFLEEEKLSPEELQELKAIIDRKSK